jgi:purine-binding chemotaxis protein CheW
MSNADETHVLTFTLSDEDYCIPIEYVEEIVDKNRVRSLPDSDPHVEGITDLRGEVTTIINPASVLDVDPEDLLTDGGQAQNRIIVLDSDSLGMESAMGWLVSEVDEVTTVADETLDAGSIGDTQFLHGLIKDDDGFTLWLDPEEFTV